jgi:hypothetical protein
MFLKAKDSEYNDVLINLSNVKYIEDYVVDFEPIEYDRRFIMVYWKGPIQDQDGNDIMDRFYGITLDDLQINADGNLFCKMTPETIKRNKTFIPTPSQSPE